MSFQFPDRVSKLLAVVLLVAVVGAAYLYIVSPVVAAFRSADESLIGAREMLERYERLAAAKTAHEEHLEALRRRQSGTGIYLVGGTDALAAAELQKRIRAAVVRHGGELRSIQSLPARSDSGFRSIAVRVQISASLSSFHNLLYELESQKPLLFVENLDVRNRRANRRGALDNLDPQLTIRVDLLGYLQPEEQS